MVITVVSLVLVDLKLGIIKRNVTRIPRGATTCLKQMCPRKPQMIHSVNNVALNILKREMSRFFLYRKNIPTVAPVVMVDVLVVPVTVAKITIIPTLLMRIPYSAKLWKTKIIVSRTNKILKTVSI